MSWFWGVLVAAVLQLVLAEVFDWFPWLARRVIRRAARLLPRADSDRYEQEWLAELDALPGRKISTLVFALGILINAPGTRRELAGTRVGGARKRALDIMVASLFLLALAPLVAIIAVAVKLTTNGPVFVAQRRVGRHNREFPLWKFRTTVAEGDVVRYLRPTRVGRLLRLTALDQLPQLWNVLVGEMSLVGPRPLVPSLHRDLGGRWARPDLTPGMTGPLLTAGPLMSLDEIVELHDLYAREWSLWKDIELLVDTVAVGLERRGR